MTDGRRTSAVVAETVCAKLGLYVTSVFELQARMGQTDRQTDRQTDKQTERQTETQTGEQANRRTEEDGKSR